MIVEVKMFGCKCDNCGVRWGDEHNGWTGFEDEFNLREMIKDEGQWCIDPVDPNKHYCPDCFSFDDEDNLVLKEINKTEQQ